MLESGVRLEHVSKIIESWRPNEVVEIPGVSIETRRLVCFEDKGFCRYYMGLKGSEKLCKWIYISLETTEMIQEIAGKRISRQNVWRYAKRHNLVAPKMMRKWIPLLSYFLFHQQIIFHYFTNSTRDMLSLQNSDKSYLKIEIATLSR